MRQSGRGGKKGVLLGMRWSEAEWERRKEGSIFGKDIGGRGEEKGGDKEREDISA